ncbi:MAG: 23S rRNA-specific endonuclease VapC20 [bacterium]|nr:23S rRNA-specific endonuclease VapC20 [bacterium]
MIFVDTGAWVALEDKRDSHHIAALKLKLKYELVAAKTRLITTNYILDETYTLMLLNTGYARTVSFKHALDRLIRQNVIVVLHITPDIEYEAWEIFERFNRDKSWSFTDCTSRVIMD